MDVATGDRAARTREARPRSLRELELVGHAGIAVPKHMGCDAGDRCTLDDLVPVLGKSDERLTDGAHRCAFLAVSQAQATVVDIHFRPDEIDDFAGAQPVRAIVLAIAATVANLIGRGRPSRVISPTPNG